MTDEFILIHLLRKLSRFRFKLLIFGTVNVLHFFVPTESREYINGSIPEKLSVSAAMGPRSKRFPSVEDRVKLYMSNWYIPPCDYDDGVVRYEYSLSNVNSVSHKKDIMWPTLWIEEPTELGGAKHELHSAVVPDKAFFVDPGTILDCSIMGKEGDPKYRDRIEFRSNMYMYCLDTSNLLLPAIKHVLMEEQLQLENSQKQNAKAPRHDHENVVLSLSDHAPIIIQYGDLKHSHVYRYLNIPHFKKFRSASVSKESLTQLTSIDIECYSTTRPKLDAFHGDDENEAVYQPIVWKLATRRHFRLLDEVLEQDTQWSKKTNMAVFRGQLTGSRDGFQKHLSPEENCLNLRRCRLVYTHAKSTLVHARLTDTRGRLPNVLNGIELVAKSVEIDELLKYKGIIMLEGNDVASGLKWSLLSQSVVLMPPPKHTSWAMEELLEPWVHYIPISESLDDVEEKMEWVVKNDAAAHRIAERGSLWMQDLVYHPDAAEDDKLIQEEIVRRYFKHFKPKQQPTMTAKSES